MRSPMYDLPRRFIVRSLLLAALIAPAWAQSNYATPYYFTGLSGKAFSQGTVDGTGSDARFHAPFGVAVDSAGNVYVADTENHTIRKITPIGVVTTLAGLAGSSGAVDGSGSAARFNNPQGVAVDNAGNVYVADTYNNTIRKITAAGVVTTFAGSAGNSGTADGIGNNARFNWPGDVAVDNIGNVYVADTINCMIRKISASGAVTTLAGSPSSSSFIDPSTWADGLGRAAQFLLPSGLAVDKANNVYVADGNYTIRKITAGGMVTTIAGSAGKLGSVDGTGSAARFDHPFDVAVDSAGIVYVADTYSNTIRKITTEGVVTTLAGLVGSTGVADGLGSSARFSGPASVAVDSAGNLFIANCNDSTICWGALTPPVLTSATSVSGIKGQSLNYGVTFSGALTGYTASGLPAGLSLDAATGVISGTPAVTGTFPVTLGAVNGAGTGSATLTLTVNPASLVPIITAQPVSQIVNAGNPVTFTAAASGTPTPTLQWQKGGVNINGATSGTYTIASVTANDAGTYTLIATNINGTTPSSAATLTISVAAGNQVTSETVTTGHSVVFSAGSTPGAIQWQVSADNGNTWTNLANDSIYSGVTTTTLAVTNAFAALNNARYRFVATSGGVVSTSNAATLTIAQAFFPFPTCIAADSSGNLYVGDANTNTIQKILSSGQVALVAGTSGTAGSADGNGPAARFNQPDGLAVLANGTLAVSDTGNATIRSIISSTAVTTLAGSASNRGNLDGTGTAAMFSSPMGLSWDASGALYVADAMNNTIRKITSGGVVSTFAGMAGVTGSADGNGTAARFNFPSGLVVDGNGTIYVADTTNNTVRKITPAGVVTTLAGLPGVSGAQDGSGSGAFFNHPTGLAADRAGNIYLADTGNSTVRKITPAGVVTTLAGLPGIAGLQNGRGGEAFFNQPQALSADDSGNIFVADTGNAAIRKIDVSGNVTTVALSAGVAPVFTTQPASQSVTTGMTVTFTVAATSSPAPTFQWQKNAVNISGATGSSYSIASASASDVGTYTAIATSPAGSTTSNAASLDVHDLPKPSSDNYGGAGGGAIEAWVVQCLILLASFRRCPARPARCSRGSTDASSTQR